MKDKVVLAFSGGLDTSYCAIYLAKELNLEVHSAIVDTGGFTKNDIEGISERASKLGLSHHVTLDETKNFYGNCLKYLIFGNILKNNTYPLSVSAERVFQALSIADYARKIGAKYIAHGSTGAGNDQVRFDLMFQVLVPEIGIITPIRDKKLSRKEEMEYLQNHGIDWEWQKAQYSINKGLWGTSVGGVETLTSNQPLPEEAYPSQLKKDGQEKLTIGFEKGEPVSLNGKRNDPVEIIREIEKIASHFAVGRDIHVGDTIIGIKGRVGFEAAAPLILIKGHHLLEKHTLTKWQQYWKEQLGNWYGMLLHEGQYLDPVMRNIEKFLVDTQQHVTGEAFVKLTPYRFEIEGIKSDNDLMSSKFGQYGEENKTWSGEDVKGFTKILANQLKIYHQIHGEKD
jgi:argininosuccinate synthase